MANYTIAVPDGRKVIVQANDPQTALAGAQQWFAQNKAGTVEDTARAGWGSLVRTVAGLANGVNDLPGTIESAFNSGASVGSKISGHPANPDVGKGIGDFVSGAMNALGLTPQSHVIQPGGTLLSRAITAAISGHPDVARQIITQRGPSSAELGAALPGGSYQAQSIPGKIAEATVPFAAGALIGPEAGAPLAEQVLTRGANVILPAAGSAGGGAAASAVARAAGADEGTQRAIGNVGRVAGGVAGGALAGLRTAGSQQNAMPVEPSANEPPIQLPPDQAQRVQEYLRSLASSASPDDIAARPGNITTAEALGPAAENALGSAARRPGSTGTNLQLEVGARAEGRPARLQSAVADTVGVSPSDASSLIQNIVTEGRAKAAPLYEQAYTHPAPQSDVLDNLISSRPSIRQALTRAASLAAEEGRNPTSLGFQFDTDGNVQHIATPSVQTLDYVKRGLDDVLEGYRDPTTGRLPNTNQVRAVRNTLTDFRGELTRLNPAYKAALSASGDYLSVQDAFDRGATMFANPNITEQQFSDFYKRLSPAEQDGVAAGIANRAFDLAQNNRLKAATFMTPRMLAKLAIARGPDAAQKFAEAMRQEAKMAMFEGRQTPNANSGTMPWGQAAKDQDALSSSPVQEFLGHVVMKGEPHKAITSMIADRVRDYVMDRQLGSQVPVRDELGRILMLPPAEGAKYLTPPASPPPRAPLQLQYQPQQALFAIAPPAALASQPLPRR
jgi:hypothetical protein